MSDYVTPTTIETEIPASDLTPLERLLLDALFDIDVDDEKLNLDSRDVPPDAITMRYDELIDALAQSSATENSHANRHIAECLARRSTARNRRDEAVEITIPAPSWESLLQDVVRRSPALAEIVAIEIFACGKRDLDILGAAVTLITADAILSRTTDEVLEDLRAQASRPPAIANPPESHRSDD